MCSVLLLSKDEVASGIRYLMSSLIEKSIKANMVIYKNNNEDNFNQLCTLIKELKVRIIGISMFSSSRKDFENIIKLIKNKFSHISIVCGGPDVNSNPGPCLEFADFVCMSDGEVAFPNLCEAIFENKDLTKTALPNIYFRLGQKLKKNELIAEENIDNYPYPFFSDENIFSINHGRIEMHRDSSLISYNSYASRGCPFQCSYCSNHIFKRHFPLKSYYRSRGVEKVVDELEVIKAKFPNIRSVSFYDEQFGINKEWLKKFTEKYKEKIGLPYFVQMNPKFYNEELVKSLKDSGLQCTSFGIQSASPRIRSLYRRPERLEEILNANKILNRMSVSHFFDIIVDNPYEEEEDYIKTLEFILKLKKPFVAKTFDLIYLPGTDLTEQLIREKKISEGEIEGNYQYKREITWRIDYKTLNADLKCQYIIALMHLAGNILVPNFIIKILLKTNKTTPLWAKRIIVKLLLTEYYNYLMMGFNNFVFMIKNKGILFSLKRIIFKSGRQ